MSGRQRKVVSICFIVLGASFLGSCQDGGDEAQYCDSPKSGPAPLGQPARRFSGRYFINTLGMSFLFLEPGTFVMGSRESEDDEYHSRLYEKQHSARIDRGVWMSVFEVSNAQYRMFDPGHKSGSIS